MFKETVTEKQARSLQQFELITKGQLTALQWEPVFERALSEMASVGIPRGETEAYLKCLAKVGPRLAELVMKDRRMRPSQEEGVTTEVL